MVSLRPFGLITLARAAAGGVQWKAFTHCGDKVGRHSWRSHISAKLYRL